MKLLFEFWGTALVAFLVGFYISTRLRGQPEPEPSRLPVLPDMGAWSLEDVKCLRIFLSTQTGTRLVAIAGAAVTGDMQTAAANPLNTAHHCAFCAGERQMLVKIWNMASEEMEKSLSDAAPLGGKTYDNLVSDDLDTLVERLRS